MLHAVPGTSHVTSDGTSQGTSRGTSRAAGNGTGRAPADGVAELRLVCLVRSGDGYVVRGAGHLIAAGHTRAHLDIAFGDAGDRRSAAALDVAVRHIQRWCELGTVVALLATGEGVTLRADDGTAVPLPACAA